MVWGASGPGKKHVAAIVGCSFATTGEGFGFGPWGVSRAGQVQVQQDTVFALSMDQV